MTRRQFALALVCLLAAAASLAAQEPQLVEAEADCRSCHQAEQVAFDRGPHARALRTAGAPSCVTCHGDHRSGAARHATEVCATCHLGDAAAGAVLRLRDLVARARTMAGRLQAVDPADREPRVQQLLLGEKEEAAGLLRQVLTQVHRFDPEELEGLVVRLEQGARAALALARAPDDAHPGFSATTVTLILTGLGAGLLLLAVLLSRALLRFGRRLLAKRGPLPAETRGRRRLLRWTLAKAAVLAIFALVTLGLIAGSKAAYAYWSSPEFCITCHDMEPYYDSWAHSTHNQVACVECHFEPGLGKELRGKWLAVKQLVSTVTGVHSAMPYVEVTDASCLRSGCHDLDRLQKPVRFSRLEIPFDHGAHLGEFRRGIRLSCTSCHYQTVATEHLALHTSTCFLCHFKSGEDTRARDLGACTTCHQAPAGSRHAGRFEIEHADMLERGMACSQCHLEARAGSGEVNEARCQGCHDRPAQLEAISDPGLVHLAHVSQHIFHCDQCHDRIEHSFRAAEPAELEQDCRRCHQAGHSAQARLYRGEGALGVEPVANDMHEVGLDCTACHPPESTSPPSPEVCSSCHPRGYSRVAADMLASLQSMLEHVAARLQVVEKALAERTAAGARVPLPTYRSVRNVAANLEFLAEARPIHNPTYATRILAAGARELAAAETLLGMQHPGDEPVAFRGESCTVCHPRITAEVGPVAHASVITGSCTACHADHTRGDPERDLLRPWNACSRCHGDKAAPQPAPQSVHPPAQEHCGRCHLPHSGERAALLVADEPQLCGRCHLEGRAPAIARHGATVAERSCSNCHDPHAAPLPDLLKAPVRELCGSCHAREQKRADGSVVHPVVADLDHEAFVHGPIRQGECSVCHDPHGNRAQSYLVRPYRREFYGAFDPGKYALCLQCHEQRAFTEPVTDSLTDFRDGATNLHFVHVNDPLKGRSCGVCHRTHAGSTPPRIRHSMPYAGWELTIGYQPGPDGGTCSPGCHESRSYSRSAGLEDRPFGGPLHR